MENKEDVIVWLEQLSEELSDELEEKGLAQAAEDRMAIDRAIEIIKHRA